MCYRLPCLHGMLNKFSPSTCQRHVRIERQSILAASQKFKSLAITRFLRSLLHPLPLSCLPLPALPSVLSVFTT